MHFLFLILFSMPTFCMMQTHQNICIDQQNGNLLIKIGKINTYKNHSFEETIIPEWNIPRTTKSSKLPRHTSLYDMPQLLLDALEIEGQAGYIEGPNYRSEDEEKNAIAVKMINFPQTETKEKLDDIGIVTKITPAYTKIVIKFLEIQKQLAYILSHCKQLALSHQFKKNDGTIVHKIGLLHTLNRKNPRDEHAFDINGQLLKPIINFSCYPQLLKIVTLHNNNLHHTECICFDCDPRGQNEPKLIWLSPTLMLTLPQPVSINDWDAIENTAISLADLSTNVAALYKQKFPKNLRFIDLTVDASFPSQCYAIVEDIEDQTRKLITFNLLTPKTVVDDQGNRKSIGTFKVLKTWFANILYGEDTNNIKVRVHKDTISIICKSMGTYYLQSTIQQPNLYILTGQDTKEVDSKQADDFLLNNKEYVKKYFDDHFASGALIEKYYTESVALKK